MRVDNLIDLIVRPWKLFVSRIFNFWYFYTVIIDHNLSWYFWYFFFYDRLIVLLFICLNHYLSRHFNCFLHHSLRLIDVVNLFYHSLSFDNLLLKRLQIVLVWRRGNYGVWCLKWPTLLAHHLSRVLVSAGFLRRSVLGGGWTDVGVTLIIAFVGVNV